MCQRHNNILFVNITRNIANYLSILYSRKEVIETSRCTYRISNVCVHNV